ncbi:ATP-citrate synthase, putative [Eimeria brunetti]|uniref:ATP citrate synthase n=1 Tax=Eimeria brunetti TaxID=51314 RepID=U6LJM5_9EIME|nr:ATP-citrate synthase, putative [Eimeria brunetti]
MNAQLYRQGSVGIVTKSGGLLNELNNIVASAADGAAEAVAVGGDRFPGSPMVQQLLRMQQDAAVKMMVMLGEVGGQQEYEVAAAIAAKKITKPLVSWVVGGCAAALKTDVSFGHAGAWSCCRKETAAAKNAALAAAGAIVPSSFQQLGAAVQQVYEQLLQAGVVKRRQQQETAAAAAAVPRVPLDYYWAKKLGLEGPLVLLGISWINADLNKAFIGMTSTTLLTYCRDMEQITHKGISMAQRGGKKGKKRKERREKERERREKERKEGKAEKGGKNRERRGKEIKGKGEKRGKREKEKGRKGEGEKRRRRQRERGMGTAERRQKEKETERRQETDRKETGDR